MNFDSQLTLPEHYLKQGTCPISTILWGLNFSESSSIVQKFPFSFSDKMIRHWLRLIMSSKEITVLLSFFSGFFLCGAQVAQIPAGGLAVLPEGFARQENQPFTSTLIPGGPGNSTGAQNIQIAKNVSFVAFTPAFNGIVGSNPKLEEIAQKDYRFAHEGPVYLPKTNEVKLLISRLIWKLPSDFHQAPWHSTAHLTFINGSLFSLHKSLLRDDTGQAWL